MRVFLLLTDVLLVAMLAGCSGGQTSQPIQTESGGATEPATQQPDGPTSSQPSGFETPEAAFAAFQTAAEENDFHGAVAALTPESQQAMAGSLVFALSMIAAFDPDNGEALTKLLEKHGITKEKQQAGPPPGLSPDAGPAVMMRALGSTTNDPAAFVEAALKWMSESDQGGTSEFAGGTLGSVTVTDNQASAMLTMAEGDKPIEFRRVEGGWLVHLPDEEFGMTGSAGGDMEFGDPDDFDFHYDEEDDLPPPEAISSEDFNKAWKVSVAFEQRPAGEVLSELAAGCGLSLFEQPDFAEKLTQPVTIRLEDVSRLQVIEAVCEQLNLYPRYKLKTMAFAEGPRPWPAAFAGPFCISVLNLDEYVPYGAGQLELEFFAAGIPTAMASQLVNLQGSFHNNDDKQLSLTMSPVTGGGQELRVGDDQGQMMQGSLSTVSLKWSCQLRNLLSSVDSIDPIEGTIAWPFPTRIRVLKFDKLEKGAVVESDGIRLTLTGAELSENSQFNIDLQGIEHDQVAVFGLDGNARPLGNHFSGGSAFGDRQQVDLMVDGRPEILEARIIEASDRVSYAFRLPSIPLPSHDQMPEQLTELSFAGSAPISLEFEKMTGEENFRKVRLQAVNNANKDIHLVWIKLEYLDADGAVLEAGNTAESGNRALMTAGETKVLECNAFFMPAGTKTVRATAESVEFADASEWQAE